MTQPNNTQSLGGLDNEYNDISSLRLEDDKNCSVLSWRPEKINSLIEDILNRYSNNNLPYRIPSNRKRYDEVGMFEFRQSDRSFSNCSSISHVSHYSDNDSLAIPTTDIEKLANSLLRDNSSSSVRGSGITVPQEFTFHTDKRKKQHKTEVEYNEKVMAECTFKPSINPTSSQMIQPTANFFDRSMEWKRKVQQDKERLEKDKEERMKKEYSFKPNVNPSLIDDTPTNVDVHEKLFVQSFERMMHKDHIRNKVLEDSLKECTFKPKLVARRSTPVTSRYMIRDNVDKNHRKLLSVENECTFSPRINNKPLSFSSGSQFYLQTNAFERLSRPKNYSGKENYKDGEHWNCDTSDSSLSVRPKSANGRLNFSSFLERQTNTLKRKEEKINLLQSSFQTEHRTFTNKSSERLLRTSFRPGDFHQRQEQHLKRKEYNQKLMEAKQNRDCTFKPYINQSSKMLPKRSFDQMSNGDMITYRKKVEELKQSIEQKENQELTFNPRLNRKMSEVKGYLRVNSEPKAYMERVKERQVWMQNRSRKETLIREQMELIECTFKPEIHEAPDYVKRIAESMALTRLHSAQSNAKKKPDWK